MSQLTYPAYTGHRRSVIPDTQTCQRRRGLDLDTLVARSNKRGGFGPLGGQGQIVIPLLTETNRANAVLKQFPLLASQNYDLQLVDAEARTNKYRAVHLDVLKNRPPEVEAGRAPG